MSRLAALVDWKDRCNIFRRHPVAGIGVVQVSMASRTKTVILKLVLHACRDERRRFGKILCARQEKTKELVPSGTAAL